LPPPNKTTLTAAGEGLADGPGRVLTGVGFGIADNENRGEEAEAHKQDQLRKQKEGKGQWKGELASESESMVGLPPLHSRSSSGALGCSWGLLI